MGEYEQLLCTARENLLKEANKTADNWPPSAEMCQDDADEAIANFSSLVILIIILCQ